MEEKSFDFAAKTTGDRYALTYRNIYRNFRKSSIELTNSNEVRQTLEQTDSHNLKIINRISAFALQVFNREDCLENLLLEIRQAMLVDRVLIYRFDRHWSGKILAESVAAGFPSAIERSINDSRFQDYVQQYSHGRVRAIANIYDTDLTECQIAALEQIAVKASSIVPIQNDNQLLGLLIADRCDAPHNWQIEEIELLKQLATPVSSVLEYALMQQERQSAVKQARTLKQTIQMMQAQTPSEIFNATVIEMRRAFHADRVLVYRFATDRDGITIAESVAPGLPQALNHPIDNLYFSTEIQPCGDRGVRAVADIYNAGLAEERIATLEQFAVKAHLVAPIVCDRQVVGALVAHQCSASRMWQTDEIDLFSQIAAQVGLALERVALLEYRTAAAKHAQLGQKITLQLRRSLVQTDIFVTATNELRAALRADRVVVCCCNGDRGGSIVAESVASGLPQTLNHHLNDPGCGEHRDLSAASGCVRAIDNIYLDTSDTDVRNDCRTDNLERFAVKSILTAPIFRHDRLFAWAIVHQCWSFRKWQQYEIDLCAQIATQVGFALEQAQLHKQLAQIAQIATQSDSCITLTQEPLMPSVPSVVQIVSDDKGHDATVAF